VIIQAIRKAIKMTIS